MKRYLEKIDRLKQAVFSVFVGKEEIVHRLCIGFFSGLHVLLEDIPGVGKTTLAKALARCTGCDFGRIQFTPDLLPGDVTGMTVFSVETREFVFRPGAVMHQFVLADELNRASPRTQSSLLQAMQEGAITLDDRTIALPDPFFVLATQNPSEFTGTFPLPEAQLDRFGLSFSLGYPVKKDEALILSRFREKDPLDSLTPVMSSGEVVDIKALVRKVHCTDTVGEYALEIVARTRNNPRIRLGASVRASRHLLLAGQAHAFLSGRDFVVPDDISLAASLVLPHRLILSADARIENIDTGRIVSQIVASVARPTGID